MMVALYESQNILDRGGQIVYSIMASIKRSFLIYPANILKLNDIARVQIDLSQKIAFDFYEKNKLMGAFILIDKITNNTSAAGMIVGVSTKKVKKREYTEAEKALNEYIRKYYPEWGCKPIGN